MVDKNTSCHRCGNPITADVKFCKNCGATTQVAALQGQTSGPTSSGVDQVLGAAKSVLSRFTNEEQDPAVVDQVFSRVAQILAPGEEILYIAVEKKLVMNLAPDCAVLTNRRFIKYEPKTLGGFEFEDHMWRELRDAHIKEGMRSATITMKTMDGRTLRVDDLPKAQARRLYGLAQSMEESMFKARMEWSLIEKRAGAGAMTMTGVSVAPQPVPQASPQAAPQEDPMETLAKLKKMVEAELITEEEYNAKKAEILAKM
jgi:Bacterial PH domain/Short C-terminal domain